MNYYKRHLGDYAKDTSLLSVYEHGCYTLLLDWYYSNEKPITQTVSSRLCRTTNEQESEALQFVLDTYFTSTKNGYINKRADEEIADYHKKAKKNREVGALGGRPKKNPNGFQNKTQTVTKSKPKRNPSHKPLANSHINTGGKRSRRVPDGFEITEKLRAWAKEQTPNVDIDHQTKMFCNHEFNSPRSDWEAAWRNWMLRAPEISNGTRNPSGRESSAERLARHTTGAYG